MKSAMAGISGKLGRDKNLRLLDSIDISARRNSLEDLYDDAYGGVGIQEDLLVVRHLTDVPEQSGEMLPGRGLRAHVRGINEIKGQYSRNRTTEKLLGRHDSRCRTASVPLMTLNLLNGSVTHNVTHCHASAQTRNMTDARRPPTVQPVPDNHGSTRTGIPLPATAKKPAPNMRLSLAGGPAMRLPIPQPSLNPLPGTNPRHSIMRPQNASSLLQSTSKPLRTPASK
jgi:hypothetical protein